MSFLETPKFPTDISYGSRGGPQFNTTIGQTGAGYENRNVNWATPLHKYDVSYGVKTTAQLNDLKHFFMAVLGRAHGFRYKDWHDYTSVSTNSSATSPTDQQLTASAIATTLTHQITKKYTRGSLTLTRNITKPVSATVSTAIASVEQSSNYFSVNYASGIIAFTSYANAISSAQSGSFPAHCYASNHLLNVGDSIVFTSCVTGTPAKGLEGRRMAVTSVINSNEILVNATANVDGGSGGGDYQTHPTDGEAVFAGYKFDVPCRFDSDVLQAVHDDFDINTAQINVIEIRR